MSDLDDAVFKRKTLAAVAWRFLERAGYQFVQFALQIVLARLLAPEQFGVIAILVVFVNLADVLMQAGMATAIVRAKTISNEELTAVFWFVMAGAAALYMLLFLLAPTIADWYSSPVIIPTLRVVSLGLFFKAYNSVQVALTVRDMKLRDTFRSTLVAATISGATGIILAYTGFGVWALVAQQLAFPAISCIVLGLVTEWHPSLKIQIRLVGPHLRFGWKLLVTSVLDTLYFGIYPLLIGSVFGPRLVGFWTQGERFPAAANALVDGTIQTVTLSAAARVGDSTKLVSLARRALKSSTFAIAPTMLLLAVCAPSLVIVLLTEKWMGAVVFMQAFCVYFCFQPVQTTNLQIGNAAGRSDLTLKTALVKRSLGLGILAVTLFAVGTPQAVAFGFALDGLVCAFVNALVFGRAVGYSLIRQVVDIAPAYGLSVVAAVACYACTRNLTYGPLALVTQIAVFGFVYLISARAAKLEAYTYLKETALGLRRR